MAGQKPVYKVQAGTVSAAVWAQPANVKGRTTTMLKASIARSYQDENGVWKSSTSFSRNEIQLAVYCLQKAFEYIIEHGKSDGDDVVVEESLAA